MVLFVVLDHEAVAEGATHRSPLYPRAAHSGNGSPHHLTETFNGLPHEFKVHDLQKRLWAESSGWTAQRLKSTLEELGYTIYRP